MRDIGTTVPPALQGNSEEVVRTLTRLFKYKSLEELMHDNPLIATLMDLNASDVEEQAEFDWLLSGSVGMNRHDGVTGLNRKADVERVMEKLYHLELLSTKDFYYENLSIENEKDRVPVFKIPATIAAIEIFQKYNFHDYNGLIEVEGDTGTYQCLCTIKSAREMEVITKNYRSYHRNLVHRFR